MSNPLKKLTIKGFKSIQNLKDFELGSLNVLIGANGAGKSNFVDFFRMLRALADEGFQRWVLDEGGNVGVFFNGPKVTPVITASMEFGQNSYEFMMVPTSKDRLLLEDEFVGWYRSPGLTRISKDVLESGLKSCKDDSGVHGKYGPSHYVYDSVSNWTVYHFHDTSAFSPLRSLQDMNDWELLRGNGGNLATVLMMFQDKHPDTYMLIR